jgi:hypothetical protein
MCLNGCQRGQVSCTRIIIMYYIAVCILVVIYVLRWPAWVLGWVLLTPHRAWYRESSTSREGSLRMSLTCMVVLWRCAGGSVSSHRSGPVNQVIRPSGRTHLSGNPASSTNIRFFPMYHWSNPLFVWLSPCKFKALNYFFRSVSHCSHFGGLEPKLNTQEAPEPWTVGTRRRSGSSGDP